MHIPASKDNAPPCTGTVGRRLTPPDDVPRGNHVELVPHVYVSGEATELVLSAPYVTQDEMFLLHGDVPLGVAFVGE